MQMKYVINIKFLNEIVLSLFCTIYFADFGIFDVEVDSPPLAHDDEDMEEQDQVIPHEVTSRHPGHHPHRSHDIFIQDVEDRLARLLADVGVQLV